MSNADNKHRPVIFSFFNKFQNTILLTIIIIIVSLYSIYFVLQDISENKIRKSIFEDQSKKQNDANKALSEHISSDLELLLTKLEVISKSVLIENGNYSDMVTTQVLQDFYDNSTSLLGKTDVLFISDDQGLLKSIYPESNNLVKSAFLISDNNNYKSTSNNTINNTTNIIESNISSQSYFKQVKESKKPLFSSGQSLFNFNNNSINNTYRIIISNPIINEESKKFMGLVGLSLSTDNFFKRLGNIYDIESQYMSILDSNATHLVHGNSNLVGKNFFEEYTQNFTGQNEDLNNLMRNVMSGKSGFVVYNISELGERLTTGYPIFISDSNRIIPTFMVFIVTPTTQIYSHIENLFFAERIETISLLVITTASIIILILFLMRWNKNLEKEISKRTNDLVNSNSALKDITKQLQSTNDSLEVSNKEVKETNEKLQQREKIQREFINIAAHELRTPVQAIMGFVEMALDDKYYKDIDSKYGGFIVSIERNANRLKFLIENLLDVARIDNNKLELYKEKININDKIKNILSDYQNRVRNDSNIEFIFSTQYDPIMVNVDRIRIYEVITNLLNNAIKSIKGDNTSNVIGKKKRLIAISVKLSYSDRIIQTTINNTNKIEISESSTNKRKNSYRYVIVSISDSGTGIPADMFDKLFKKFNSFSEKGVGLGLFISKGIVEAHGGQIYALNNDEGNGATFVFSLPISNYYISNTNNHSK